MCIYLLKGYTEKIKRYILMIKKNYKRYKWLPFSFKRSIYNNNKLIVTNFILIEIY